MAGKYFGQYKYRSLGNNGRIGAGGIRMADTGVASGLCNVGGKFDKQLEVCVYKN